MKLMRTIAATFLAFVTTACATAVPEAQLPDPLAAGWKGQRVCEKLHEDQAQRILRCTFPPGVGHERHYHRPHFGYALSGGRMRIRDARGVREVELATGSSYASDGVDWHEVLNVGETTVVYLIVESKQARVSSRSGPELSLTGDVLHVLSDNHFR